MQFDDFVILLRKIATCYLSVWSSSRNWGQYSLVFPSFSQALARSKVRASFCHAKPWKIWTMRSPLPFLLGTDLKCVILEQTEIKHWLYKCQQKASKIPLRCSPPPFGKIENNVCKFDHTTKCPQMSQNLFLVANWPATSCHNVDWKVEVSFDNTSPKYWTFSRNK